MPWSYNQIDMKVSRVENVLGDVSVNTALWERVSLYGLMRGRPTTTSSTIDAQQLSIPGKLGKPYSTFKGRSNATLEFEVLIVDAWPFAGSELTVRGRIEYLKSLFFKAKRVAYKEPGRDWDSFFIVYNTNITEQDADEKACVLKIKMEVHPQRFNFSGNVAQSILPGWPTEVTNLSVLADCYPIYKFPTGFEGTAAVSYYRIGSNTIISKNILVTTEVELYIDVEKQLAYYIDSDGEYQNGGRYAQGDYRNLIIPTNCTEVYMINTDPNNHAFLCYPRNGALI